MIGITAHSRMKAAVMVSQLGGMASKYLRFMATSATEKSSLPKLPVPALDKTLSKYLRSVKPLLNETEFQTTMKVVKKFAAPGGIGEKLQKQLEARADQTENWLSDWWLQVAYLEFRYPVVVHSSPGLVFPLQAFSPQDDQVTNAAKVISGALDYHLMLDEKRLPTEKMGGQAVDMSQYYKIMGTCRIPGVQRDSVAFYSQLPNPPKHIVVARNNHFFKVTVIGDNGKPLSEDQILGQLKDIVAKSKETAIPIGVLSTDNRNNWGKAYKKLLKDRSNYASLEAIQSSLFLMCLDKPNVQGKLNKQTIVALQMVHGGGGDLNSGNRWFDKTIQLIVGTNGEVGLTYEHSPAEGPPVSFLMDHIIRFIESKQKTSSSGSGAPPPELLKFNTSDVTDDITTAKENLARLIGDLEMSCFTFDKYGSSFVKSMKMSPDSFIQMAIQLSFYRLHGEPGSHYESASLRMFNQGRTETIRSCSTESVEFAKAMLAQGTSDKEKEGLMRRAVEGHKEFTKGAVTGHGVDRHLLGLKLIALEDGGSIPPFFQDPSFSRSTYFRLSTSQVPSSFESAFMCYGPLVPDGYGCCYNPRPKEMVFGVSAFNSHPETSSQKFKDALVASFDDMHDVLVKTQKSKL